MSAKNSKTTGLSAAANAKNKDGVAPVCKLSIAYVLWMGGHYSS
jgi:hypothetical protein